MRTPLRQRIAAATLALATAATLNVAFLAQPSSADDDATLTVVGTSDVFDSNLVQSVLKPGFEAATDHKWTLNYVSKGTGAAIDYAKAGTASAMIVHAAALENQFVDQGFSLEQYGRAIFWGDYVLIGPSSDPAGVLTGDSTFDIRHAFEKVAAAGAQGKAHFVSRGGTPGTTVQEHAIWAQTTGVATCDVSAANGGGKTPSTGSGACPGTVPLPDWYKVNAGSSQAQNVTIGNACNYSTPHVDDCYVFTDRGTFQYLESIDQVTNLHLVTRPDKDGDPALSNLLVNSFHAYGINPAKFTDKPAVQINTTAATAFLDWITSPAAQQQIAAFLSEETGGDPPFIPSASPVFTDLATPTSVDAGDPMVVTGKLSNEVPGTPALDGVAVKLLAKPASAPGATATQVATGTTDENGEFAIQYKPSSSQLYSVAVDDIAKVEIAAPVLDPEFGDILEGTSADVGETTVAGAVTVKKAKVVGKKLEISGKLRPKALGKNATVTLLAGHPGKKLKAIDSKKLKDGDGSCDVSFKLGSGTWRFQVRYSNPGVIQPGASKTGKVTIP